MPTDKPETHHTNEARAAPSTHPSHVYAEQDMAQWNSLLLWAREQRGPQWDASTGLYVQKILTR